jgi:Secretion system C-terminal sorting domain
MYQQLKHKYYLKYTDMKKLIISTLFYTILLNSTFAQSIQASIGEGSVANSVKVYLKTTTAIGAPISISTLQFDVAIPESFTPRPTPTLTRNTTNFPDIAAWTINNGVEGGYYHYIIETGSTPISFSKLDGTETEVFQIVFAGSTPPSFSLVTLPEGGTSAVNNAALFLATSGTIQSNGSSLYYTRPGTTVSNGFSYDLVSGGTGTTQSFATLTSVVPTKFTAFSAVKKDNDGLLNFVVENETASTLKYEVERSIDGTTFEKINTLVPLNNGVASNVYNVIDANVANIKNNGIFYYRIKQIDADGVITYTEIRSIRLVDKAGLSAFPNPAKDYTNVRIDVLENTEVTLTLVNAEGKQVMTKTLQAQKGTNLTKVDMSPLASGNYLVKAMVGGELKTISIIKL